MKICQKKTKIRLFELINKSKNNWEITLFEKYRYQLLKDIYEEPNFESINILLYYINSFFKFKKLILI